MSRRTNAGPYVIAYADYFGKCYAQERQTWRDACELMRELLLGNFVNITVKFV